jgi:hypothetical protein
MTNITNGQHERPKDATITEGYPRLPEKSGSMVEGPDEAIESVRSELKAEEQTGKKEDLEQQLERPKHGTA